MAILCGVVGVVLLVVAGLLGICGWRCFRRAALLGIPLLRIAKLTPGHRKARGRIVATGGVLRAPITNKLCVYYRLRVKQERRRWTTGNESSSTDRGGDFVAQNRCPCGKLKRYFVFDMT